MDADWAPSRWWRVADLDGRVWCETSNEREAHAKFQTCPYEAPRLYRLYERSEREWRLWP